MTVLYDNSGEAKIGNSTSVSVTLTIGSGANAIAACLMFRSQTPTNISVSGAGATGWALVAGTDSTSTVTVRTLIWAAVYPSSGSQTVTATWTGSDSAFLGVITASGVDPTTPVIHGTFTSQAGGFSNSHALAVTSAVGNLAFDILGTPNNETITATGGDATQVSRWTDTNSTLGPSGTGGSTDAIVSGTVATMKWTYGTFLPSCVHSGADFLAAPIPLSIGLPSSNVVPVLTIQQW